MYIPTVWQTRVSEGVNGDLTKRKWRLKRVWESCKDKSKVIDNDELEYLVDELELEDALISLLGVPNRKAEDLESRLAAMFLSDLADSRWEVASGGDKAPAMKPWRIQRVWEREGEIFQIDDEQSLDASGLLEVFTKDNSMPADSLVMDYLREESDLKETTHSTDSTDETEASDMVSITSRISDDDTASYLEDGLDEDELLASLGLLGFDDSEQQISGTTSIVQEELRVVDNLIRDIIQEGGSNAKKERLKMWLQEICDQYLGEMSGHRSQFDSFSMPRTIPSALFEMSGGLEHRSDGPEETAGKDYRHRRRDPAIVLRKLRKAERLMSRMIVSKGEHAKTRKLYRRLDEKRTGYLQELGVEFRPLEYNNSKFHSSERIELDGHSSSLHSLLDNLQCLNNIIEDDSKSQCSMGEERRCKSLLRRKIHKVEKMMQKILKEKGEKGKSRKLYIRLERKLAQYRAELENQLPKLSKNEDADHYPILKNQKWDLLKTRIQSAFDIVKATLDTSPEIA
jgi:hypothetical protein